MPWIISAISTEPVHHFWQHLPTRELYVMLGWTAVSHIFFTTHNALYRKWNPLTPGHLGSSVDSFTVSLHLPAVRAVQGNCQWPLQNGGNSHWPRQPIRQWDIRQSQQIFRPTNHKACCQPIGGHVSYQTDSPTATTLGLCSSPAQMSDIFYTQGTT